MDLPLKAIRQQVASAINLIIQLARLKDGSRKIVSVTEVVGWKATPSPCRRSSSSSPGAPIRRPEDRGRLQLHGHPPEDHRPPLRHGRSPAAAFGQLFPDRRQLQQEALMAAAGRQMGNGAAQPAQPPPGFAGPPGLGLPPSMPPGWGCRPPAPEDCAAAEQRFSHEAERRSGGLPTRAHAQPDPMPLTARIPATPRHAPLPEPAPQTPGARECGARRSAGPSASRSGTLALGHADLLQGAELRDRLDALGDNGRRRLAGKRHQGAGESPPRPVDVDPPGQRDVELDDVRDSSRMWRRLAKPAPASSTATRTPA